MNAQNTKKPAFYRWSAKIDRSTLPELQAIAGELGFIVTTPGVHDGDPSPPRFLDSLAAAYRHDASAVLDALREIGVVARHSTTD